MIVMKFGGTSVADGPHIGRAAEIVASHRTRRPVVVVSAMAGVTDQLLAAARAATEGRTAEALAAAAEVERRHRDAVEDAVPPGALRGRALARADRQAQALRRRLLAAAEAPDRASRSRDAVASMGELMTSSVLAASLEGAGVPARWVDARRVVITDAVHGRANPDRLELAGRARLLLGAPAAAGALPVTQGFIGATRSGTPTTMGRGASDYTAALLGAALDVHEVEIWTDVDGLMTADPRVAPDARSLDHASYEEAAELAYFGARVLHAPTILPLFERGIPISIRNVARPDGAGTRIGPVTSGAGTVKSIAAKGGVTTVSLRSTREVGLPALLVRIFGVIARHGVSSDVVASGEATVSLTIEAGGAAAAFVEDLAALGDITVSHGRAIISVVGDGLHDDPGVTARARRALGPVAAEIVPQVGSKLNLAFVVSDTEAPAAVRRLHAEFFPQ